MPLLDKMLKAGSRDSTVIDDSRFFNGKDLIIDTGIPIINLAFSGDIKGGFTTGLTILSGASKSFKTLLGLICMKAYLDKYPEAVAIFYDSEFGTTPAYLKSIGIDTARVIHVPIEHVEQLKFDMTKRLEQIKLGDKVYFFVDSLGNLASKKEVEDAQNEKSVADMTRAKAIRSWLRIITPHLAMKELSCVVVNHVYQSIGFIPQNVIPGGTAVMYSANSVFVISKAQEKDSKGLIGYKFTINIEKSRYVKEKSKLPFIVNFNGGLNKYSGLLDIALESGHVVKPKQGWYSKVDQKTGEIGDKSFREKNTSNKSFWSDILNDEKFITFARNKYKFSEDSLINNDDEQEEEK